MSETPSAAVKRMQKELANIQKLRANVALALLGPLHDEAVQRIKDTAATLSLPATILLKPPGLAPIGTPIEVPVVTPPSTTTPLSLYFDRNGHALYLTNTIMDTRSNRMGKVINLIGGKIMIQYADNGTQGWALNGTAFEWRAGGVA
jgi:hypothetical protein